MFASSITVSSLSLFQTVKSGPQGGAADIRVSEAIETIKSLVSGQLSPANKQAANLIGGTLIGETAPTTVMRTPEEIRERLNAKIEEMQEARANWVEPEHATYPPFRSIADLNGAKARYERGQGYLERAQDRFVVYQEKMENAPDQETAEMYRNGIQSLTKSVEQTNDLLNRFDQLISDFEALTRSRYNYSGKFLHKSEDGTYSWGDFKVTNKYTGEVAFENNGDGRVKRLDGIGGQPYFYTPLH